MGNFHKYCITLGFLGIILFSYQNCGKANFSNTDYYNFDSQGNRIYHGQITVGASNPNPPLKLFFVVDNSASMYNHQIDLGQAFSKMFTSNSDNISLFDTTLYLFSTASTFNQSFGSQIPTQDPSQVSNLPTPDDTANVAKVPGNIFGYWAKLTGTFGSSSYSVFLQPAPILAGSPAGFVTSSLFIPKKGKQTDSEYGQLLSQVTSDVQNRLSYLNPNKQASYQNLTDVSSGLCTMSRILKHSSVNANNANAGFMKPGDAAAFVIVSDDNDRLNVRNPNGNSCLESGGASSSLVDGNCGHYTGAFTYNTVGSVGYQNGVRFKYEGGTTLQGRYASGEFCSITYDDGSYNYSWTYTALKTKVTYIHCDGYSDGTCNQHPGYESVINGAYSDSSGGCTADMSKLVDSPYVNSTYKCAPANVANVPGAGGVDSSSNGTLCSNTLLLQLQKTPNIDPFSIACTITGAHQTTTNLTNQALGSCSNACNGKTHCTSSTPTTNYSTETVTFSTPGLNCASACPDSGKCGSGTISGYFSGKYGSSVTCTSSGFWNYLYVNPALDSNLATLSCSSSNSGLTFKNNAGSSMTCTGTTIQDCIGGLQNGGSVTLSGGRCTLDSGYSPQSNINTSVGVTCNTLCSDSKGVCTGSGTVKDYIASTFHGICDSSSNGGKRNLALRFDSSIGNSISCSTLCNKVVDSSNNIVGCDGSGWGVSDLSTVSDYVTKVLGGDSCSVGSPAVTFVADSTLKGVDSSNTNVCLAGQLFKASGSPYPGVFKQFVTGDPQKQTASDLRAFNVQAARSILGSNVQPAVAVLGHLASDNLPGTDVSSDYIAQASDFGSDQVNSVFGDYSVALSKISQFIVRTSQNQFSLPVDSGRVLVEVQVLRASNMNLETIEPSQWTWAGQTLTINASVGLKIGDQLLYVYR